MVSMPGLRRQVYPEKAYAYRDHYRNAIKLGIASFVPGEEGGGRGVFP